MRRFTLVPIAALLMTTPASTMGPAQPGRQAAAARDPDEVCRPFMEQWASRNGRGYGRMSARSAAPTAPMTVPPPVYVAPPPVPMVAPPAPPPPPPPPSSPPPSTEPSFSADASQEVVVTGTLSRRSNSESPSPVTVIGPGQSVSGSHSAAAPPMAGYVAPGQMAPQQNRERYEGEEVATVQSVAQAPVSTFSVDVDTGSYSNVRRMLTSGSMPPQAAVRTEEMLNYFRYDYPAPRDRSRPFSITSDMTTSPWNPNTRLLRVGLRGYDLPRNDRPPANLVFLVDVSGSMQSPDKLPLVQCSLALVAERMSPRDRVSIVVYAGATGLVLAPTADRQEVIKALARLEAGGSTAGAAGLQLAYETARRTMVEGGVNRVILATDGDFNVGVTNNQALIDMVERERASGITLTTLGYGTGNYNEAMMEQIADHGNGNYAYIDSPREAMKALDQELASTLFTIAHDVKIQVEFNPAYVSEYRLIGYENRALREQDFDNDAIDAGEIGAGHQVTALYEIVPAGSQGWTPGRRYDANRPAAGGNGNGELAFLRLRYKLPGEDRSRLIERPVDASLVRNARAPRGDTAFAAGVAAYGQLLRGDPWLGTFTFADARRLASGATGSDWWRREFVRLTELAEQQAVKGGGLAAGSAR